MPSEQLEQESLIRQRMAEEETVREKTDDDGNKWTKVYFGGGAHLKKVKPVCRTQGCRKCTGRRNRLKGLSVL